MVDIDIDIDTDEGGGGPEQPGDHDALPHIPATDPATIPADRGDAGRAVVAP